MPKKLRPAVDLMAFKCRTLKVKLRHSGANVDTSFLHWLERRELFSARAHTHKQTNTYLVNEIGLQNTQVVQKSSENVFGIIEVCSCQSMALVFCVVTAV
jgi:hypothetical protein